MKKITMLLCLMFLMGGSACKDQTSSPGTGGPEVRPSGRGEFAPPGGDKPAPRGAEEPQVRQTEGGEPAPPGGHHPGPPPEAFKACEGKTAGSTAQFVDPRGETVKGKCEEEDGKMVLRPDRPLGNPRDGRRGPPPEAYQACEGKSVGSVAQFVDPRGEAVKGTCEEEDGKLVIGRIFSRVTGMDRPLTDPGKAAVQGPNEMASALGI